MKLWSIALMGMAWLAAPAAADTMRGYVTQIEINSAVNEVKIWVAPEKGIKGPRDVQLDVQDTWLKHKLALARDSLLKRLPVKLQVNDKGIVTSFALRYYPSSRQLSDR